MGRRGNKLATVIQSEDPGSALDDYLEKAERWFSVDKEAAEALFRTTHKDTIEMKRLFDLPTGELENPDEILSRANEALLQLNLQQAQETTQLQIQNQQLTAQAMIDGLTGCANRRYFDEFIGRAFADVSGHNGPLSILFFDTDHFKHVNDIYGHQTGDRVLVEQAKMLIKHAPPGALVARYGGEEFAIVLPDCDRLKATCLAETYRTVILRGAKRGDHDQCWCRNARRYVLQVRRRVHQSS